MIDLNGYKISSISFTNNVPNGTELQLQHQVKYHINYQDDEQRCIGTLDFRIEDKQMQDFEIRIQMVGVFRYSADEEKADIHTQSFDQLFPFLRQAVSTLTAASGMPGLMIPLIKLDRNSVAVNNNPSGSDDENTPLN